MAKATPKTETVTVMKPVEETQTVGVTLELSIEEAKALNAVLSSIGGMPRRSNGDWSIRGLLTDAPGNPRSALAEAVGAQDWSDHGPGYTSMRLPAEIRVVKSRYA